MKGSRNSLLQKGGRGGDGCGSGSTCGTTIERAQRNYQYRKWLKTKGSASAHRVKPSNAKCHAISDLRDRKT